MRVQRHPALSACTMTIKIQCGAAVIQTRPVIFPAGKKNTHENHFARTTLKLSQLLYWPVFKTHSYVRFSWESPEALGERRKRLTTGDEQKQPETGCAVKMDACRG